MNLLPLVPHWPYQNHHLTLLLNLRRLVGKIEKNRKEIVTQTIHSFTCIPYQVVNSPEIY